VQFRIIRNGKNRSERRLVPTPWKLQRPGDLLPGERCRRFGTAMTRVFNGKHTPAADSQMNAWENQLVDVDERPTSNVTFDRATASRTTMAVPSNVWRSEAG
jgi:hypothetical protein